MGKISKEQIVCPKLEQAYDRAVDKALTSAPTAPVGCVWPPDLGNHVTTKGTLTGQDYCSEEGKIIEINLNLKKYEAINTNTSSKMISIELGTHSC